MTVMAGGKANYRSPRSAAGPDFRMPRDSSPAVSRTRSRCRSTRRAVNAFATVPRGRWWSGPSVDSRPPPLTATCLTRGRSRSAAAAMRAPLLTLWGTGPGVRGRRLRMVTRESGALADAVRQTALETAAERRRTAAESHATVLEHTTRMVARADEGELDEVATETRAALAAMRELDC